MKWYKMLNWVDKRMKSFRMSKITIYHCTSKLKAMSYSEMIVFEKDSSLMTSPQFFTFLTPKDTQYKFFNTKA